MICADEIQKKYDYLYSDLEMPDFKEEYIVAVDVATENLLGDLKKQYGGKINLCIDHHGTNDEYSEYLLLNADAAAACEVILKVIKSMNVEIDRGLPTVFHRNHNGHRLFQIFKHNIKHIPCGGRAD